MSLFLNFKHDRIVSGVISSAYNSYHINARHLGISRGVRGRQLADIWVSFLCLAAKMILHPLIRESFEHIFCRVSAILEVIFILISEVYSAKVSFKPRHSSHHMQRERYVYIRFGQNGITEVID